MNKIISFLLSCLLHTSLVLASTYTLRVELTPDGAGSLNTTGGTYEVGESIYLRSYNNTGFVFKGWYEGDSLLASSSTMYYTMPAKDVLVQAKYEYDPTVPSNPAMPDTTKVVLYSFTASVSPEGAGTLNTYGGEYEEDESLYLRAYQNTNYYFKEWVDENGKVLTTSSSFYYTMPSSDTHLTAVYYYDPTVPSNPDSIATRYTVNVISKPNGGGTFNTNQISSEAGNNVRLYAYTNTGFQFKHWENESGDKLSTSQTFDYTIPNADSKVYGVFEYNPQVPSNPNKNNWDKSTGEVIVDDFKTGSLNSAISQVTDGNSTEVTMITVSGKMSSNDFGIANNYSNCTLIDLKRTYGFKEIPSYAYDYNSSLQHIILPSCVEQIGYRAFYQCSNLSEITCYAIAPPEVESNAFTGIAEGAVLHVLSSAIPLYAEAEGWKNFTILPLTEEVQTLEVNLPAGSEDGRYKNMTLELVNAESGQKQKYVISDRVTYTFNGLLKKSLFNVYVKNNMGAVLGLIENIAITDDDVSVTFESLLQPQDVTLSVQTPDGTNVTSQVQIRWFDSESNYLQQSNKISGLLAGTAVRYRITLPQALGMQYIIPTDSLYTIQEDGNALVCTLQPIEEVTISGRVKDVTTGSALSGAVVSVSQKLNGLYSKAFTVKTDNKGGFTAKVFNDQSTITVSASDYLNQIFDFANFNETTFVGEVALKGITGATITTNLTYTTSVVEGGTAEVQNWYADYANVAYEIYNETQQRAITQFNVQYPSIVLLEEVAEGDVLKLTASSRTNAFVPVTAMATIDAQNRAETTFNIVELGAIRATFTSTDNASVVGILYDNKGQLVKKYTYGNALLSISNLAEGDYTLVTMTNSTLFNSILNLSQFAASGLMEGTDYVQNTVTVKSGVVATIVNDLVPVLDESKLYYTGDKTLFSVNKTSIVAGNYLTLKGMIDFKSTYAAQVSNVNMVVDLPETCSFVENSVMVGSSIAGYTLDGNRLTIPLTGKYTDQVRFCIIPTLGGEYAPNAFAQFSLDNKDVLQPIGSAKFAVKDLTISVPSTVAKTTIPISGTALGNSTIEVFDNGVKIGETTSLANGVWSTTCELDEPYNLSTHSIYAKVTTKQGLELQSETQNVLYDRNAIEAKTVTMLYYNPEFVGQYSIVFDFINRSVSPESYYFFPYKSYPDWVGSGTEPKDFTFVADLTNNDTTVVSDVDIYVFTDKDEVRQLPATYDAKKDKWVAVSQFELNNLPINVSVDFDENSLLEINMDNIKECLPESVSSGEFEEKLNTSQEASYLLKDKYGKPLFYHNVIWGSFEAIIIEQHFKNENAEPIYQSDSVSIFLYNDNFFYYLKNENSVARIDAYIFDTINSSWKDFKNKILFGGIGAFTRSVDPFEPEIADPLGWLRDARLKKILKEAREKYKCADPDTQDMLQQAVRHLRYGISFLGGNAVANTVATTSSIQSGDVYGSINNGANFGAGIDGLMKNADYWKNYIHSLPKCPNEDPIPDPQLDPITPIHDPSGYVYEGVSSNRIEGVMASCYYKETVEDMYGDLHENVVLWDAEQYAQENPLFTDENGMYRWDVPQGLWQVKFEKEGYETTYSEWLPVPPPQLEVNIGMVHNKQPEVKTARAYEDGIEVEFDKYMQLDGLTTENIFVTKNGETAAGTVTLLNEEQAYEDNPVTYASKVRFVPENSFLTTDEVILTVSRKVKSYAGIQMESDYSQEFDIEKEIKSIIVDSIIQVSYNGEKEIVVSALPYDAAIGKKLIVNNSSSMILSVSADTLTFDENGQVKLSIMGELPGTSMLTFTVAETDINSMCEVQVITEVFPTVETPVSSLASGTAVYRGTLIELSTGTKDAVIYYTLDGNCPCEEQYQIRYTSPIAITDDSTVIKAIAVADGKYDSDVVEFNYTIRRNSIDVNFEKGWNWVSHSFESPISPSEFAVDEGVSRILSQTQEAIRDPQLGLVGTLTELTANESYKVETTTATERQRLSDIAWNPATPIGLNAGWNWIGYPITQIMSVNEAFATTAAETLDVVVGQNGFAQFDGEKWVGTLETMSPGMGYMYQSQSAKNVVYNTSIVSTAAAMYAHGISRNLPLVIDIHKYGQIMPVIATINNADDYALNNEDYQVAAFCGSECRGIGRVVDGLVMMNVYGNINDNITFQVSDINGEKIYNNTVSLSFIETVVGDIFNPFAITVNGTTGISEVEYSGRIKVTVLGDILKINGINADEIKYVEIYDINGLKVSRETNITKSGIRVSNLIDGVYVVVVNGNGEYSYHKIAVHKNN